MSIWYNGKPVKAVRGDGLLKHVSKGRLVVKYKFDKSVCENLLPEFNEGFAYIYTDEYLDTGDIVTRSIYSHKLPTLMRFGTNGPENTARCNSLLEVSNMNTKKLIDCAHMFSNCNNLTKLIFSNECSSDIAIVDEAIVDKSVVSNINWNPSNVTNMSYMFFDCKSLTSLDLSSFDTSNVTNMGGIFQNCNNLATLDLSNFDTSNVTNMGGMFTNCNSLISVLMNNSNYVSVNKIITELPTRTSDSKGTLNIAGVNDIIQVDIATAQSKFWNIVDKQLVARYTANTSGILPEFNQGYVYTVQETEENGIYTVEIYSGNDFSKCSFESRSGVISLDYLKVTKNVTDMSYMFRASSFSEINTEGWDTSNVTDMNHMFARSSGLTSLDLNNLDTSNVTDMNYMFEECTYLTDLNISNWDTSSVTNMNSMFRKCMGLTTLDINDWDVSSVTDMVNMFYFCELITSMDLSKWDISNVTNMTFMFYYCSNLASLDISNWRFNDTVNISRLFFSCYNLTNITMNNSNYNSVNKIIAELPNIYFEGTLYIIGVDDVSQVNIESAQYRYWNVITG